MTRNSEWFYQRWYYAQLLERKRRGENVYTVFDSSWNTGFNGVNYTYSPHADVPNVEAHRNGVADGSSRAVKGQLSHTKPGKWYFEITMNTFAGGVSVAGIGLKALPATAFVGSDTNSIGYRDTGDVFYNNAVIATLTGYGNGDVIGALLDFSTGNLALSLNGTDQGFLWPSLGTHSWFPAASLSKQFNVAVIATTASHLLYLPAGAQPWN